MSNLVEFSLLLATILCLLCGGWCIYWVKMIPCVRRARLGRWLFVFTLLMLGAMALLAAIAHPDGLAPLGLLSGLLIVGMLWESPSNADVPNERAA